ncbi:MAG: FHA domain-containing protein [Acidobacteria bacterium]|nr:FHA domain-containing protein [Acidobacteriota bacterium]
MRVRFDVFTLDGGTRELLRRGALVGITPKALALLEYLVRERPRAVSKREILERIWPDVIVEEQNVKNLVREIRAALADDATNPRFIRTVFGHGYAFCAEAWIPRSPPGLKTPRLVHAEGVHHLAPGENVIGRGEDCSIVLDYSGLSRHHATVRFADGEIILEDLGSKNGTWLNGRRIEAPELLRHGDRIRIGTVVLEFRADGRADTTSTLAGF